MTLKWKREPLLFGCYRNLKSRLDSAMIAMTTSSSINVKPAGGHATGSRWVFVSLVRPMVVRRTIQEFIFIVAS